MRLIELLVERPDLAVADLEPALERRVLAPQATQLVEVALNLLKLGVLDVGSHAAGDDVAEQLHGVLALGTGDADVRLHNAATSVVLDDQALGEHLLAAFERVDAGGAQGVDNLPDVEALDVAFDIRRNGHVGAVDAPVDLAEEEALLDMAAGHADVVGAVLLVAHHRGAGFGTQKPTQLGSVVASHFRLHFIIRFQRWTQLFSSSKVRPRDIVTHL